jgi:hypothetical protein
LVNGEFDSRDKRKMAERRGAKWVKGVGARYIYFYRKRACA